LTVKDFTRDELHLLFGVSQELRTLLEKHGALNILQGRILANIFYEPSSRTSCSFASAMQRLGGSVISIDQTTSSIAKGESLADTIRSMASYSDVIVLRSSQRGSAEMASKFSTVPVINAGDGTGEHPTQAFLDVFTIREELGTVNGLTITLVGDLKHGRTVHSLVRLLSHYHVKFNYVSPPSLRMPEAIRREIASYGNPQTEHQSLDEIIPSTDVLYVTRIQKERFESLNEYEQVKNSYVINNTILSKAKEHMIVMHPLPRIGEIDSQVDFDPRAAYFRQMRYGMFVRMALLTLILGRSN